MKALSESTILLILLTVIYGLMSSMSLEGILDMRLIYSPGEAAEYLSSLSAGCRDFSEMGSQRNCRNRAVEQDCIKAKAELILPSVNVDTR